MFGNKPAGDGYTINTRAKSPVFMSGYTLTFGKLNNSRVSEVGVENLDGITVHPAAVAKGVRNILEAEGKK